MIKILVMILMLLFLVLFTLIMVYIIRKIKEKSRNNNNNNNNNKIEEISTRSTVGQNYNIKSVFDFMDFENIEDNMIVQKKEKKYLMVVECQGINYDLMSDMEKTSVESGFIQFLNTLRDPIQIYIQTRTINLERSIVNYKERIGEIEKELIQRENEYNQMVKSAQYSEKELNEKRFEVVRQKNLYDYGIDIIKNTENMSLNKNILRKKYYIIVSYFYSPIDANEELLGKSEIKDIAFSELYTRCQSMIRALATTGVLGRVINSYELVDLLYSTYNRDEAETFGVGKAAAAEYDQLYVQTQDVLDKKMKAINQEIERRALEKAEQAVDYVRSEKEKAIQGKEKSMEELIEELAKNLIKSNEQYLGNEMTERAIEKIEEENTNTKREEVIKDDRKESKKGRTRRTRN